MYLFLPSLQPQQKKDTHREREREKSLSPNAECVRLRLSSSSLSRRLSLENLCIRLGAISLVGVTRTQRIPRGLPLAKCVHPLSANATQRHSLIHSHETQRDTWPLNKFREREHVLSLAWIDLLFVLLIGHLLLDGAIFLLLMPDGRQGDTPLTTTTTTTSTTMSGQTL